MESISITWIILAIGLVIASFIAWLILDYVKVNKRLNRKFKDIDEQHRKDMDEYELHQKSKEDARLKKLFGVVDYDQNGHKF